MIKNIKVYRLKSDNWNSWVSAAAYKEIRLSMSTGDFHTHRVKCLMIDANQLEHIKWHGLVGFVDLFSNKTSMIWALYDGMGDVNYEGDIDDEDLFKTYVG